MLKCPDLAIAITIASTLLASAAVSSPDPAQNIPVCVQPGNQYQARIVVDGQGGAIVTWTDYRAADDISIRAQRISPAGEILWGGAGAEVGRASDFADAGIPLSDGAGGVFVVWSRRVGAPWPGGEVDLFAQHLGPQGQKLWAADGMSVCTAREFQLGQDLTSDGAGGLIVSWEDHRELYIGGTAQSDIYAQRLDASGSALWTENGVMVCTADGTQHVPRLVSDDAHGAVVVWADYRAGFGDIYAQRVGPAGERLWPAEGVSVCVGCRFEGYLQMVPGGEGGAIALWHDGRDPQPPYGTVSVFAQKLLLSGAVVWPVNGIQVSPKVVQVAETRAISDGAGGAMIAWQQNAPASLDVANLRAQHIDADGAPLWSIDGVTLDQTTWQEGTSGLTSDGAGGAFLAWSKESGIYARRISKGGSLIGPGAQKISTTDLPNVAPSICSDGSGGAFVSWSELRLDDDPHTTQPFIGDLYAGRLLRSGRPPVRPVAQALGSPEELSNRDGAIQFSLSEGGPIAIRVFDTSGRCVRRLAPGEFTAGTHRVTAPVTDEGGARLRPGVYFYQLTGASRTQKGRFVILR
ncbi:MAG TPA: hypothetical protein VFQ05_08575 [Candidatus Eisenbacteria bacterium]|nr:hypothetical protein [Candidatus Eisenbacteria bacterium]